MAITLFAYWMIGMPLGWWLTFNQGMGARGMWIGSDRRAVGRRGVVVCAILAQRLARALAACRSDRAGLTRYA